jgi:tRNA(fMet)-specific endonuclease VapC
MASGFLLDTCILVHLVRGDDVGRRIQKTYNLRAFYKECLISVVTCGEMEKLGREFGWDNAKLTAMRQLMGQLITVDINDTSIIHLYAEIDCYSDQVGKVMGKNDAWIAATAKATGYTLITNDNDFDHLHPHHLNLLFIDPDAKPTP